MAISYRDGSPATVAFFTHVSPPLWRIVTFWRTAALHLADMPSLRTRLVLDPTTVLPLNADIVDTCKTGHRWQDKENFFIQAFRARGHFQTNMVRQTRFCDLRLLAHRWV